MKFTEPMPFTSFHEVSRSCVCVLWRGLQDWLLPPRAFPNRLQDGNALWNPFPSVLMFMMFMMAWRGWLPVLGARMPRPPCICAKGSHSWPRVCDRCGPSDVRRVVLEDFVEEPVLVFPDTENATVCILEVVAKSVQVWVKPFAIRNFAQHPCAVATILRSLRKAGATVLATTQHDCARAIRALFVHKIVRI